MRERRRCDGVLQLPARIARPSQAICVSSAIRSRAQTLARDGLSASPSVSTATVRGSPPALAETVTLSGTPVNLPVTTWGRPTNRSGIATGYALATRMSPQSISMSASAGWLIRSRKSPITVRAESVKP